MLRIKLLLGILVVSSLYFFSAALQAVAFSFFIGAGNTLSISIGYTVLVVFNLIKDPIRELPMSIGFAIEFLVSMKRIQKFLLLEEINETVVSRKEGTEGPAVEVKEQSNFLWGIRKNDDEKDKEEEKEHKEVLKKRKQVKKSKKNATEVYEEDGEDAGQREQPLLLDDKKEASPEKKAVDRVVTVEESMALKNFGLTINKGEFVCIIGDVGSGKSSLLSSLIGDLLYIDNAFKN